MAAADRRRVAGVLLAAGASSRMSPPPKQLRPFLGEPLVRRAARAALAAPLAEVLVVLGHRSWDMRRALVALPLRCVDNPRYGSGQASSVAAGVRACARGVAGALFLPCDQPLLDAATIAAIVRRFRGPSSIVVPRYRDRTGAPVLFGRRYFDQLAALTGDQGGRRLLERYRDAISYADLTSERPLLDVDTEGDLARLEQLARRPEHHI